MESRCFNTSCLEVSTAFKKPAGRGILTSSVKNQGYGRNVELYELVPFAVSDAAIAGAAGVLGALAGAVAAGGADYLMQRRQESTAAKVGARLVTLDLARAANLIARAEGRSRWSRFDTTPMPAWREYGPTLAAALSVEEYKVVADSVSRLAHNDNVLATHFEKEAVEYFEMAESDIAESRGVRERMTQAYNALCRLAGLDKTDETLGEPSFRAARDD